MVFLFSTFSMWFFTHIWLKPYLICVFFSLLLLLGKKTRFMTFRKCSTHKRCDKIKPIHLFQECFGSVRLVFCGCFSFFAMRQERKKNNRFVVCVFFSKLQLLFYDGFFFLVQTKHSICTQTEEILMDCGLTNHKKKQTPATFGLANNHCFLVLFFLHTHRKLFD